MECNDREDPIGRMVRDSTPQEFVDWMVKYHKLPEAARETVESNLREQFKWHRLQGRLDQRPTAAVIAEVWGLRGSTQKLEKPPRPE